MTGGTKRTGDNKANAHNTRRKQRAQHCGGNESLGKPQRAKTKSKKKKKKRERKKAKGKKKEEKGKKEATEGNSGTAVVVEICWAS